MYGGVSALDMEFSHILNNADEWHTCAWVYAPISITAAVFALKALSGIPDALRPRQRRRWTRWDGRGC